MCLKIIWISLKWLPIIIGSSSLDFIWVIQNDWNWRGELNTLKRKQNGRHFADGIFTCIFFNEKCHIFIEIPLKFSLRSNKKKFIISSNNGLSAAWCQAVIWTNNGLLYWGIYVSFSLSVLIIPVLYGTVWVRLEYSFRKRIYLNSLMISFWIIVTTYANLLS